MHNKYVGAHVRSHVDCTQTPICTHAYQNAFLHGDACVYKHVRVRLCLRAAFLDDLHLGLIELGSKNTSLHACHEPLLLGWLCWLGWGHGRLRSLVAPCLFAELVLLALLVLLRCLAHRRCRLEQRFVLDMI